MMCAGRVRLSAECKFEHGSDAKPSYVTPGFAFVFADGSANVRRYKPRSALNGKMKPQDGKYFPSNYRLDPLCLHLHDDDADPDCEDEYGSYYGYYAPAYYCGYYGSRWAERLCSNDGSVRRVTCDMCEVRCCVETCIWLPSRRCRHCVDVDIEISG